MSLNFEHFVWEVCNYSYTSGDDLAANPKNVDMCIV